jgi:hypothetical protein
MKKTYTIKLHKGRVKAVLRLYRKHPGGYFCPAQKQLKAGGGLGSFRKEKACSICTGFIGLSSSAWCPCTQLGPKEALRRTREALADYAVGSHPMSPEPRVARPQKPEER